MNEYPWIYRLDVYGSTRRWRAIRNGNAYRTESGTADGSIAQSDWRYAVAKNVDRSNATTPEEQADSEIQNNYRKRIELGWSYDPNTNVRTAHFQPMLAAKYDDVSAKLDPSTPVFVQPKLDGIRCIVTRDGMFSRNGKAIVSCPHIINSIYDSGIFDREPELILDGELYNHELKNDFNRITSIVRKTRPSTLDILEAEQSIQYHVYDGFIDPSHTFAERKKEIRRILDFYRLTLAQDPEIRDPIIKLVWTSPFPIPIQGHKIDASFESFLDSGYEGMMVRLDTPYENKRCKSLLKRKPNESEEFLVARVEEGVGNWSGKVKRFVILLEDGSEQGAGVRGSMEKLSDLLTMPPPVWATVSYQNRTPDNKLRFPIVTDWGWSQRED